MASTTAVPDADLDRLLLPPDGPIELPESLQMKIVTRVWHHHHHHHDHHPPSWVGFRERYSAYFNYFRSECYNWRASRSVAIETYRDFLDLVDHLKANRTEPRSSPKVLAFFPPRRAASPPPLPRQQSTEPSQPLATRHHACGEESISNAIDLTVRLWLTINVSSLGAVVSPAKSSVEWPQHKSLDEFITATFQFDPPSEQKVVQWPKMLNVYNLNRIGGFTIHWTSNLADHLLFDDDLEVLYIYHLATVLEDHRNVPIAEPILPAGLMDDTLHSLALIIPRVDQKCQRWFEKEKRIQSSLSSLSSTLDSLAAGQNLGRHGRSVATYQYWNDRLAIIVEAFNKAEPRGMSSWWRDRRNPVQWYTFWIAAVVLILTIIFGLIQSITGILQAYAAYHPIASR